MNSGVRISVRESIIPTYLCVINRTNGYDQQRGFGRTKTIVK